MDNFRPFWSGVVTVAPDSGGIGTTGMVINDTTDTPPTGDFDIVVRRPIATNGNPKDTTATILRGSVNAGTGAVTNVIRDLGGAVSFAIQIGDEVYQYMGSLLEQSDPETLKATGAAPYYATAAGIQKAITDAAAQHKRWVLLDFNADVTVSTSVARATKVGIKTAPNTRLGLPAGSTNGQQIFQNIGTASAGVAFGGSYSRHVSTTTLTAGGVNTLGLAANNYVIIKPTAAAIAITPSLAGLAQYNRVYSVNAGTDEVQLFKPLSFNVTAADYEMLKILTYLEDSPLQVEFANFNNNTGGAGTNLTANFAVFVQYHFFCSYEKSKFDGFSGGGNFQSAIQTAGGYGNTFRDLYDKNSGTAGFGAFEFNAEWAFVADNIHCESNAFGLMFNSCGDFKVLACRSDKSNTRCIKFQNCRDCHTFGIEGNLARGGGSGIMCGNGYNQLNVNHHGPVARGNTVGIQTDGTGSQEVRLYSPNASGNTNLDYWFVTGDLDCEIHKPNIETNADGLIFDCTGRCTGIPLKEATVGATPGIAWTPLLLTTAQLRGKMRASVQATRTSGGAVGDGGTWEKIATFISTGQVGATSNIYTQTTGAIVGPALAFGGTPYIQFNGVAGTNFNWQAYVDLEVVG